MENSFDCIWGSRLNIYLEIGSIQVPVRRRRQPIIDAVMPNWANSFVPSSSQSETKTTSARVVVEMELLGGGGYRVKTIINYSSTYSPL